MITPASDSVFMTFNISFGYFAGSNDYGKWQTVESTDGSGHTQTYDSSLMKEYGYTYKEKLYKFRLKPTQKKGIIFLKVLQEGKRATLYEYSQSGYKTVDDFYSFEKPDGSLLFLKSVDRLQTFRDRLAAFYGDTPAFIDFIKNKFARRGRIRDDVKTMMDFLNKE